MKVPLIIRFPEQYQVLAPTQPGGATDRLVSFVDFGPTLLSLADVEIPDHMQGKAFLGEQEQPPRDYVYGIRDRMDERVDCFRAVRDKRYKYIRNFMPHMPYFQFIEYMYRMPSMQAWQAAADAGTLEGPAAQWMTPHKPVEELYDLQADPYELNNLAGDPEHAATLERMRNELTHWMLETRDLALLPEAEVWRRADRGEGSAYVMAREQGAYDMESLFEAVEAANTANVSKCIALLEADDPAARYWSAIGLGFADEPPPEAIDALKAALDDDSAIVRVTAADALISQGEKSSGVVVLLAGLEEDNPWVQVAASLALDRIPELLADHKPAVAAANDWAKNGPPTTPDRQMGRQYLMRVTNHLLENL